MNQLHDLPILAGKGSGWSKCEWSSQLHPCFLFWFGDLRLSLSSAVLGEVRSFLSWRPWQVCSAWPVQTSGRPAEAVALGGTAGPPELAPAAASFLAFFVPNLRRSLPASGPSSHCSSLGTAVLNFLVKVSREPGGG